MPERLDAEGIDEIARRFEAGEPVSPAEFRAVCDMALELLQAAPSQELVRVAMMLVSSRGALPLKSAQAEALGAAILRAAQASQMENARRALQDAHAALSQGRNWIEGLGRIPAGSKIGPRLPGLARSLTKTMQRHLAGAAETLQFGMAVQLEPLDPAEPGYKDVPALEQIPRRPCATELERAHETLRVARLGILKLARFTQALSIAPEARTWDDALAQHAAGIAADMGAHLAELALFADAPPAAG